MAQLLFYDLWFPAYFKLNSGRYIDNMQHPGKVKNHGEMIHDGDDYNVDWFKDTNENALPPQDDQGDLKGGGYMSEK